MKKIRFLLALMFIVGLSSSVIAQRAIKNGFSLGVIVGFPTASYGVEDDVDSKHKYKALFGLQLGNRWYISPQEKFGAGIMVNWLDFSMAVRSGSEFGSEWARATLDFTLLEFGPVGTYAINDDMAIDGYYNLRPTIMSTALIRENPDGDQFKTGIVGGGFTHTIGAAFRWKVLNVGLEYVMGGINSEVRDVDADEKIGDITADINNFRIILGVKF